jgi:hypothetical protein
MSALNLCYNLRWVGHAGACDASGVNNFFASTASAACNAFSYPTAEPHSGSFITRDGSEDVRVLRLCVCVPHVLLNSL